MLWAAHKSSHVAQAIECRPTGVHLVTTTIRLNIGPRLCRRPAAAARNVVQTASFPGVLRLVEDDTAAIRRAEMHLPHRK
jgi:hypothetical protein